MRKFFCTWFRVLWVVPPHRVLDWGSTKLRRTTNEKIHLGVPNFGFARGAILGKITNVCPRVCNEFSSDMKSFPNIITYWLVHLIYGQHRVSTRTIVWLVGGESVARALVGVAIFIGLLTLFLLPFCFEHCFWESIEYWLVTPIWNPVYHHLS